MNTQQEQFQRTHTTDTHTLNEIVQKAMDTNIERMTRINRGQSNEVYFIDLKEGSFVLRIAKGCDYDIFAIERWAMQEVSRRGVPVAAIVAQGSLVERDEVIFYQVQEKLAGEPMDTLLAQGKVGRDRSERLTEQARKLLAAIHSVSTVGWGRIATPHHGSYSSFEERMLALQDDAEKFDTALAQFNTLGVPRFEEVWQGVRYLESFAVPLAHGSVFTPSPSLGNLYTIQLFKVLQIYSHRGAGKVETIRANTEKRLTTGSNTVACGGLKPISQSRPLAMPVVLKRP